MSVLIETRDVKKRYGDFVALDGVTLSVSEGEMVSIVGPNGAGKSTLVNVLTGLLRPSEGIVRFKGRDIAGIGPVRLARQGMARAFQLVHIFPAMTVAETIAVAIVPTRSTRLHLFRSIRGDATVRARAQDVAAIFGLDRTIGLIHESGCTAGLVFNPATPLDYLDYTLDKIDLVLLMSVNPGFGGQSFIPSALDKLRQVRERIDRSGRAIRLEIDGGVKVDNIGAIAAAGADTFVAGSAIFGHKDYRAVIAAMLASIG